MKFDEIDMSILQELQKDSRLSYRELSKHINLSPPSVTERVRKLESEGIIQEYTININKKGLGFGTECIVQVTMRDGQYDRFIAFIQDYKYCEWCYRIAGAACFIVKLTVASLDEVEKFINNISSYALTNTSIVFSEVKIHSEIEVVK
ncbi:Lrp/AsnC family transcriptional regulator [Aminipila terrae]|uniref:Winged helix-turn-helix transcriptional regulator n=1 Tax=Aminipila terrae TaxID=2697030 RepID=A0A6P1MMA6_9FIRM|nr:Lrp/AsnC family transcriptional regulator [Aminipila terrae]QHI72135.1 winged helix-turn-helix transcriptional regulator [Aminipila terrae]